MGNRSQLEWVVYGLWGVLLVFGFILAGEGVSVGLQSRAFAGTEVGLAILGVGFGMVGIGLALIGLGTSEVMGSWRFRIVVGKLDKLLNLAQPTPDTLGQGVNEEGKAEKTKKENSLRQIYSRPIGKAALWVSTIGVATMTAGALGAILTLTPLTSNELLLTTYLIGLSISLAGISLLGATLSEMHTDERFDELTKMINPPAEKNAEPETPKVPQTGTPELIQPNEPHED